MVNDRPPFFHIALESHNKFSTHGPQGNQTGEAYTQLLMEVHWRQQRYEITGSELVEEQLLGYGVDSRHTKPV